MSKKRKRLWTVALIVGLVSALVGGYLWPTGRVLGQQVSVPQVEVLRVVQAEEQPLNVILPVESVTYQQEQAFVQVVSNQRVSSKAVTVRDWRWPYVRVTAGLADADLVVVAGDVQVGEVVNYRLLNPEAGQSGEVR